MRPTPAWMLALLLAVSAGAGETRQGAEDVPQAAPIAIPRSSNPSLNLVPAVPSIGQVGLPIGQDAAFARPEAARPTPSASAAAAPARAEAAPETRAVSATPESPAQSQNSAWAGSPLLSGRLADGSAARPMSWSGLRRLFDNGAGKEEERPPAEIRRSAGQARLAPPKASAGQAPPIDAPLPRAAKWTGLFLTADWVAKALVYRHAAGAIVFHYLGAARTVFALASPVLVLVLGGFFLALAHSREPLTLRLERLARTRPALAKALAAATLPLLHAFDPEERRFGGDLADDSPALRRLQRWTTIAIAAAMAGAIGNQLEGLVFGRSVDFIPLGLAHMNIADAYLFLAMPFVFTAAKAFGAARAAWKAGRPAELPRGYGWPLAAIAGFLFITLGGWALVPPMIYPAVALLWRILPLAALYGLGKIAANLAVGGILRASDRERHQTLT